MMVADSADLSGDFDIEVINRTGDKPIPGYFVESVSSESLPRLIIFKSFPRLIQSQFAVISVGYLHGKRELVHVEDPLIEHAV
jgi:hypothetical protein